MSARDARALADKLEQRTAAVGDSAFVEREWQRHCTAERPRYLGALLGLTRYERRLVRLLGKWPWWRMRPDRVAALLTVLTTESNREIAMSGARGGTAPTGSVLRGASRPQGRNHTIDRQTEGHMRGSGLAAWALRYRARNSPTLEGILDPAVQERLRETTPAVVAPAFNATGLGIIRDLGREGVPVIAVDHYPKSIGLASRYAVPTLCHDPRYDEEGLLEDLERIGDALPQRAVLFPAFDDHVWTFSRHAERLEQYYILPFARWTTMQRLADKETQLQAAWAAGVDTPRTFFVHGPDDLEEAAREVPFPALFKPLRHQEMRRRFGVKVVLAETVADLPAAYEKARVCGGTHAPGDRARRRPGLLHLRGLSRRLITAPRAVRLAQDPPASA